MIDWRVISANGSELGPGCAFPDFDHQTFLLPFFDVGGEPIDPYDGGVYRGDDVVRLRRRLLHLQDYIESKPDSWTITDTSAAPEETLVLRRQAIQTIIERTLRMLDVASEAKASLVFCGD